jgi:hypothetical protein
MTWALWLAVPVGATTLAALTAWIRGVLARRAARPLTTQESVREHGDYLDALVIPAHSTSRCTPGDALRRDRADELP